MTVPQRYGITFPFDGIPLVEQRELVRELVDLGYTDLWSAESGGYDAFMPLALAAQWAPELRFGTAIVPAYTRGPRTRSRRRSRRMCQAAPGRFALGIGTSSNVIVERWNGMAFDKPYQRVRDTIRFLRAALTGEKVDEEYETFTVQGLPARHHGARAAADPRRRAARGHVAARGTRRRRRDHQLALGRRREDGRAARRRPTRRSSRASSCSRSTTPALARAVGKRAIASYLTVPVYAAFHEWLGRGDELSRPVAAVEGRRPQGRRRVDPRPRRRQLLVWGKPEACREHIQRYIDNGVTTPAPALFSDPTSSGR